MLAILQVYVGNGVGVSALQAKVYSIPQAHQSMYDTYPARRFKKAEHHKQMRRDVLLPNRPPKEEDKIVKKKSFLFELDSVFTV